MSIANRIASAAILIFTGFESFVREYSKIIRGEAPKRLLNHSILTPSLAASVFTAKYVNAVPLNRISEGYGYDGIHISRQVMAGWTIKLYQYYLEPVHRMMRTGLMKSK